MLYRHIVKVYEFFIVFEQGDAEEVLSAEYWPL